MMRLSPIGLIAGLAFATGALLVAVGAMMPWATAPFGISKAGIEGDGVVTLLLGLVAVFPLAGFLARSHSRRWHLAASTVGLLAFGLTSLIAIYDMQDVQSVVDDSEGLIRIGSGLYLTLVGSLVGAGGSFLLLFADLSAAQRDNRSQDDALERKSVVTEQAGPRVDESRAISDRTKHRWPFSRRTIIVAGVAGTLVVAVGIVGGLLFGPQGESEPSLDSSEFDGDRKAVGDLLRAESQAIAKADWEAIYLLTDPDFRERCTIDEMVTEMSRLRDDRIAQYGSDDGTFRDLLVRVKGRRAEATYVYVIGNTIVAQARDFNPDTFISVEGKWFDYDDSPEDCNI